MKLRVLKLSSDDTVLYGREHTKNVPDTGDMVVLPFRDTTNNVGVELHGEVIFSRYNYCVDCIDVYIKCKGIPEDWVRVE